jgi:hypothetical protein
MTCFDGLDVSQAQRLKSLEDENAKLKKLLVEAMLDPAILKEVASRKSGCARCDAEGGGTCRGCPRCEPASGVRRACDGPFGHPP